MEFRNSLSVKNVVDFGRWQFFISQLFPRKNRYHVWHQRSHHISDSKEGSLLSGLHSRGLSRPKVSNWLFGTVMWIYIYIERGFKVEVLHPLLRSFGVLSSCERVLHCRGRENIRREERRMVKRAIAILQSRLSFPATEPLEPRRASENPSGVRGFCSRK